MHQDPLLTVLNIWHQSAGDAPTMPRAQLPEVVIRILQLFYSGKIMVFGDVNFREVLEGLGVWFFGCPCVCPCQFGTDLALVE